MKKLILPTVLLAAAIVMYFAIEDLQTSHKWMIAFGLLASMSGFYRYFSQKSDN